MTNASNDKNPIYPAALTIAGSDSGGGAGIQADLRTFNAFAVYGCCAVTAVTSQNPFGVRRIDAIPAAGVAEQIAAVMEAFEIGFGKTGMLFSAPIVEAVAEAAEKYRLKLVVDPVMVATSGAKLLQPDSLDAMKNALLPRAAWITPNLPEAELLLERKLPTAGAMQDAALELSARFGTNVVLKSGHCEAEEEASDFVAMNGEVFLLASPRLEKCAHSHGTGCTFSAALAANLALKQKPKDALLEAKTFVFGSLVEPVQPSQKCRAMYPPEEDYSSYISFRKAGRVDV